MAEVKQDNNFDTYRIGETTYRKASFGPKTWSAIQDTMPGKKVNFVDIMNAKFEQELQKKIDIHK